MKHIGLILLSLFLYTGLYAQTPLTQAVDFNSKDVHGIPHHLFGILDNDQQYVLIDFFSVTCGPCQSMAPIIDTIYHYFGSNEQGLFVVAIDQTFDNEMVMGFEEEYNTHYPAISGIEGGGGAIYTDYEIPYYPSLILIAPNHEIVEQAIPIPDSAEELVELLESYGLITIGIEEKNHKQSFELSPNPAKDIIRVTNSLSDPIQRINIYTATGREITTKAKTAIADETITVDIGFLEKGIYLISAEYLSGERSTKTFIKN